MTVGIQVHRSIQATSHSNRGPAHRLSGLLAVICLSLFASSVFAVHPYDPWAAELGIDQNVSYDGIRVMELEDSKLEMTERRAPGKMYTEIYLGDMTAGVILREDLAKSYILMPSMGFYREDSLDSGLMQASNGLEFSEITKVGNDDISGHSSTKYKALFKDKQGTGDGFIWVTDTGVPIKMDMVYSNQSTEGQRIIMYFTELNLREQDPAYFEVPADLKPMSFGGGLSSLGQMMGMGAEPPTGDSGASAPATSSGSSAGGADTIQSVTDSVSKGTKGLIKGMGMGGLFGMSDDEPEEEPREKAASSPSSGNLTQAVQIHLKALGYDPGKMDGEASVQTSIAISQFQAEKGLEVTGEVSPQLAGILEAEVEK